MGENRKNRSEVEKNRLFKSCFYSFLECFGTPGGLKVGIRAHLAASAAPTELARRTVGEGPVAAILMNSPSGSSGSPPYHSDGMGWDGWEPRF